MHVWSSDGLQSANDRGRRHNIKPLYGMWAANSSRINPMSITIFHSFLDLMRDGFLSSGIPVWEHTGEVDPMLLPLGPAAGIMPLAVFRLVPSLAPLSRDVTRSRILTWEAGG